jgi:serine/threonine protein kinase
MRILFSLCNVKECTAAYIHQCFFFQLCQDSLQGLREAMREVLVLGSYRHPQLLPLLSFCLSRQDGLHEVCLVYPLMLGGALDCALAGRTSRPLGAAVRLRIAADAAAGLAYLHAPGGGLGPLLHRDVKSSNVLLDEGLRARVADVGLARPQRGATMSLGVGTFGYMDPGYFESGERPRRTDDRRYESREADNHLKHCRTACNDWKVLGCVGRLLLRRRPARAPHWRASRRPRPTPPQPLRPVTIPPAGRG